MEVWTLRPGRDAATRRRHPWLFSGSVGRRGGDPSDGVVEVRAADGAFLGRGLASLGSPIVVRLFTFEDRPVDAALVTERLEAAFALRARVVPEATDGYRLVNAEGDFLPGLVVDRYGDTLVVQASTEGIDRARALWLPPLLRLFRESAARDAAFVVAKNDLASRKGEGLTLADEALVGESVPALVPFREHGLSFVADVGAGQKTGFFLDQRENRALVGSIAKGKRVLNLFSYSGGFGVYAMAGGAARVTHVDSSAPALELARENHRRNGHAVENGPVDFVAADVFDDVRARVAAGETWDVVVTDPPAFAKRKPDVDRACRGYKDVNRLAMKLLAPGGTLLACSCSGPVDADLFQKVLFSASLDAGVPMRLLERRGAGEDHPVSLDCPEGEYLKAFRLEK
ncbi:MAG TPA: class I SAM-dependent rRNA methyltransferase [Thermoanaerobaculia bacterium]|nr:class I SAM-dependent rRNA methyltransferase [Thermoanaerobaculia bacterium]